MCPYAGADYAMYLDASPEEVERHLPAPFVDLALESLAVGGHYVAVSRRDYPRARHTMYMGQDRNGVRIFLRSGDRPDLNLVDDAFRKDWWVAAYPGVPDPWIDL